MAAFAFVTEYKGSRQAEGLDFQLLRQSPIEHIQACSRQREHNVPGRCIHYHSEHEGKMTRVSSLICLSVHNGALSVFPSTVGRSFGDPGLRMYTPPV